MTLHHIDTAPMPEMFKERVPCFWYCPDEGGWHTGFWWDGAWRLHYDMQQVLTPTHWLRPRSPWSRIMISRLPRPPPEQGWRSRSIPCTRRIGIVLRRQPRTMRHRRPLRRSRSIVGSGSRVCDQLVSTWISWHGFDLGGVLRKQGVSLTCGTA